MCVKNNEDTIGRCLDSAKAIADCLCICNLGSSDKTISLIQEFLKNTNIPGEIYTPKESHISRQFSSTIEAQKAVEKLGLPLNQTYFLMMDPEEILHVSPQFDKAQLTKDSYLILEKSETLSLYNYHFHLLRANLSWINKSVTFGDWTCEGQNEPGRSRNLMIVDPREGKKRAFYLQEMVDLLSQTIANEPDNPSHNFYLAQTYKALGDYEPAIETFHKRLTQPTHLEEFWCSKYMLGECYEALGKWGDALYWFLEAFQENPRHLESLRKLSEHYRYCDQFELSYLFARHGTRFSFLEDPLLQPIPHLSDHQFDLDLSIISFYTSFSEEGYEACDGVLLRRGVPWWLKGQTYQNILFYTKNLPIKHSINISIDLPLIEEGFDERFHPMNPSIQRTEQGYEVICRSVNYVQKYAKHFRTVDKTGRFRTKNYLVRYDRNFNLLSQQEIIEEVPRKRYPNFNGDGLEDCRLFFLGGKRWFTCTTTDTNPMQPQVSLCKLVASSRDSTIPVETLTPLKGPDINRCEKNWLPFVKDDQLHIIYSCDPFIIYKPDLETGVSETVVKYTPGHDFSHFRGSAAPVAFDKGYLMLVHEVVFHHDFVRNYLHRFVYMDDQFNIQSVSRPFTFTHQGVEFCCGMTLNHSESELILTVGLEDWEARLLFIDCETIRQLLNPLPKIFPPPFGP